MNRLTVSVVGQKSIDFRTMQKLDNRLIQSQVERWNEQWPVSTPVRVKGRPETKVTRTQAMILFEQRAIIYLEGHCGYFDLDEVTPAAMASEAPFVAVRPAEPLEANACWMFPGQGSQKTGMGGPLFEVFPELVRRAEAILGYDLKELCLNAGDPRLDQTQFTQPALYVVNALTFLSEKKNGAVTPGFFAGHSLGEYSALFAAGVFDFETGLRLVQRRGALMAEVTGGGMAAIVGLSSTQVKQVLRERGLQSLDLANLNSPTQIVVSGPAADIERAQPIFEEAGARLVVHLKVSGAFHSRYMRPARDTFFTFLDSFTFQAPRVPVISNVEACPYPPFRLKDILTEQLTSPVRWTESVQYLLEHGVKNFTEHGPGNVLMGLVRKIQTS